MDNTEKNAAIDLRVVAVIAGILVLVLVFVLIPQETWVKLSIQLFK
jgi:hypothetical protein